MKVKSSLSIILTAVMLLSMLVLTPISADAVSYADYFTVNSPTDESSFALGSMVDISVTPRKYKYSYWTKLANYPNYIGVEIFKGNESIYYKEFIYNTDGKRILVDYKYWYYPLALGVTQTDTFEPTETGEYTIQFKFWAWKDEYKTKDIVQHEYTFSVYGASEENTILGDADGNGEVDMTDATVIQRVVTMIAVPYDEEQLMRADVDGDGELTVVDATFIQRYSTKVQTPYPIGEEI